MDRDQEYRHDSLRGVDPDTCGPTVTSGRVGVGGVSVTVRMRVGRGVGEVSGSGPRGK